MQISRIRLVWGLYGAFFVKGASRHFLSSFVIPFFCSTRAASILPSRPRIPSPSRAAAVKDGASSASRRLVWGFLCQGSITPFFVVLCHSILLFDPRREHSSVPTAYSIAVARSGGQGRGFFSEP